MFCVNCNKGRILKKKRDGGRGTTYLMRMSKHTQDVTVDIKKIKAAGGLLRHCLS